MDSIRQHMAGPAASESGHFVEVAVPLQLERTFSYRVPAELASRALPGRRAYVPFGGRRLTAYIIAFSSGEGLTGIKELIEVLDDEPLWTPGELEFFRWAARYYRHPLGEVLKAALPAGINVSGRAANGAEADLRRGGGRVRSELFYRPGAGSPPRLGARAAEVLAVVRELGDVSAAELRKRFGSCTSQLTRLTELSLVVPERREVYRDPFRELSVEPDRPRELSADQAAALGRIVEAADRKAFDSFLLHGVTGSGKTEVYLQAISHLLPRGGDALVLVPEIALTPQMVRRFRARFGDCVAVLHSALSDGERYDEWRRIRRGQARIVIGARSAVFAPLANLALIVVDEEHESSFKQAEGFRYNARDLALVRGSMERCPVVLGSATPLMTSMYAVSQGRLKLLALPERVACRPLPVVECVPARGGAAITPPLAEAIDRNLAEGRQTIIFLNRRGFSTFLVCAGCGAPLCCPDCSVTLTYHRQRGQSVCHYCDYAVPAPGTCPACGGSELKELGAGTERVEHELRELFPAARILRMDSDTTAGKGGHERILSRMADGSADILVGTQMISKGHDFPGVTLVGIINGESGLNMPDFRGSERTFQTLSQVIGRAGRGEFPGRVLLQARDPGHYAIRCAAGHDFEAFCREELAFRREAGYPPFSHLACIGFSGAGEGGVEDAAARAMAELRDVRLAQRGRVELLGPAMAPLYRLRGRYRRQILLKAASRGDLRRLLDGWLPSRRMAGGVRVTVDIDPVDMM